MDVFFQQACPLRRCGPLQLALVQLHDLLHAGVAGVAGTAGVSISGLGEEPDILFLQDAVQVCGDAHVSAQLLDSGANSVDVVTGATATSEAITAGVNQALAIVANLETDGSVQYVDSDV